MYRGFLHVSVGANWGQNVSPELELWLFVNILTKVLETRLGSYARAVWVLRAESYLQPQHRHF